MSLDAFDILREKKPDQGGLVSRIEVQIKATLRADPAAVIDDWSLTQILRVDHDRVALVLVYLVELQALKCIFTWPCPNQGGTVKESEHLPDFPRQIECDRCGGLHDFDPAKIDVFYLPSDQFRERLLT